MEYTLGLPPFRRGGLPQYSKELSESLSNENDVTIVYPGHIQLFGSSVLKLKMLKTQTSYKVCELINPLPVSLGLGISDSKKFYAPRNCKYLESFLRKNKFDVIHLHTLMGLPLEFLQIAKKMHIRLVYTTHDFYGLCPKNLEKDTIKKLMSTKCSPDCMICPVGPSSKKLWLMQSKIYMRLKNTRIINSIRRREKNNLNLSVSENTKIEFSEAKSKYHLLQYYEQMFALIDKFHFNSEVSKKVFMKFFPNIDGEVLNVTRRGLYKLNKNRPKMRNNIVISYVGPYDYKKGFFKLTTVLESIRKENKNFEVHICGDNKSNISFLKNNWVKNYGILTSSKMEEFYSETDVLVMPSIWHETFGFAVLEALCNGVVCFTSRNVGASDLLPNYFIFKNTSELIKKLNFILKNPSKYILEKEEISKLVLPIDFEEHVKKIVKIFY